MILIFFLYFLEPCQRQKPTNKPHYQIVKQRRPYIRSCRPISAEANMPMARCRKRYMMDSVTVSRRAEYALEKALRDAETRGELTTAGNPTGANQYKSGIGAQCTNSTKKPSRSTFVPDKHEAADLRKMGDARKATPVEYCSVTFSASRLTHFPCFLQLIGTALYQRFTSIGTSPCHKWVTC